MAPDRPPAHYPYITRHIMSLFAEGALPEVRSIDVEPEYGYVVRLNYADGRHCITYGNDLGINIEAAAQLAKDKGYTKFMLKVSGVKCPDGEIFLLPSWAKRIHESPRQRTNPHIRTTAVADPYVRSHFGYPVYIKPVDGSKGINVFKVNSSSELTEVFKEYEQAGVKVALVEQPVKMPDYRIVTLDGALVSAYRRIPLTVYGDGKQTIAELISALQIQFTAEGRDTKLTASDRRIVAHLNQRGQSVRSIPNKGDEVVLLPISNLSAGGTSEDVTQRVDQRWVDLAARVAANFNLRLSGLDLACADITNGDADYSVLEVNAAPGLDHYASSGEKQRKLVDQLYATILNNY